MDDEINVDKFVAKAKSLGLKVFYGTVDESSAPAVHWDNEQGDYVKFLTLAKDLGVSMVIIGRLVMSDSVIDGAKLDPESFEDKEMSKMARELNDELEDFRKYVGKVGSAFISWVKDGAVYSYMEATRWFAEYANLMDVVSDLSDALRERWRLPSRHTA
ncbi:hypothetical protein [Conexivisphaera calida]|uniref:Uncharacterized protein n=1 Tax=Conexivisphaera calida TaxID=1874277 RepID=A0A4P2VE23_9ARCH|nr:hypothetical protein [Conexivisphaera calida]BBE42804.1 hypothetical protein NAS2_1417 [Conexivisphaera calida]